MVTIDAVANTISMAVSNEEIAVRLSNWKAPPLKVNRGTLAKYAHLVGDASHGVCQLFFLLVVVVVVVVIERVFGDSWNWVWKVP